MDYNKYINFPKENQVQVQDQYPNQYQYQPRQEQYGPNQMNDYNNNQYQPRQEQYAPNQMNDYNNNNQYQPQGNRMNDHSQYQPNDNYQPPLQRDYQDNNSSLYYKYDDNIPNQPSMRNNNYQQEHIPTPTGQRLMQAGASSMYR